MEYLALEIFDLDGIGSKYANLPENASITITDTSEIFASGDVWSYSFKLNVFANVHIFGSAGDLHGSRLHEQVNKRRARLWVMGVSLYLGYLKLGDEVEVDEDGDVSVTFESGQKTFREMIEGMNAREVSVGDVQIGIALNRKRPVSTSVSGYLDITGLAYQQDQSIEMLNQPYFNFTYDTPSQLLTQRWPKLVLSKGHVIDYSSDGIGVIEIDNTNVQEPYSAGHPFCNVNICYQKKVMKKDETSGNETEQKERGYTVRLGRGDNTTTGGDGQTRFNNAPNFFLIYWLERLFKDKGVVIQENQMMNVDGLCRVFLANLGCFYEEMDLDNDTVENYQSGTPEWKRYGKFSFPHEFVTDKGHLNYNTTYEGDNPQENKEKLSVFVKRIEIDGVKQADGCATVLLNSASEYKVEEPTGYIAYATGDNYPDVEAAEIINSTEAAFGVRFLFNRDFTMVRIVLLRNIFQNTDVQEIDCEVIKEEKVENSKRGFVMTYGGDEDDTTYNYDDWSRLDTTKSYQEIVDKYVTSFNKTCYLTPNNGNAYRIKIDEDEVSFNPVLVEVGGYNDAKDGNCDGEEDTIETVTIPAKPLIMNDVDGTFAVFFSGDMKAPGAEHPIGCKIPIGTIDDTKDIKIRRYNLNQDIIKENTTVAMILQGMAGAMGMSGGIQQESAEAYGIQQALNWATLNGQYTEEPHSVHVVAEVYCQEEYTIHLQDNYDFSGNDGTPFDKANIGLCFGMMRGSGLDSYIFYSNDTFEEEGNDWWETMPGSKVIDHPDSCDNYGNRWDFSDDYSLQWDRMPDLFHDLFSPLDQEYFRNFRGDFAVDLYEISAADNKIYNALMYDDGRDSMFRTLYVNRFNGHTAEEIMEMDSVGEFIWRNQIIELDSSMERCNTLKQMIRYYKSQGTTTAPVIHNGVSSIYGNFSLKLRAEKPNQPITDPNLQKRGLADRFYKEYSYWIRNARILRRTVKIELAQLLSIDKTKRTRIFDVMGFVLKIQYTVSNKTGLGLATFEILYI